MASSDRSLRRALLRWGSPIPNGGKGEPPKASVDGDKADVVSRVYQVGSGLKDPLAHPDDTLEERGLDPDEWEIKNLTVNEWEGPVGDGQIAIFKQIKLSCVRKRPAYVTLPARIAIDLPLPTCAAKNTDLPRSIVCVSDQHAPFHDVRLHELFQQWLSENRPDEGLLIGDTIDLPNVSRHPAEPDHAATTQECVDAGGQLIYDYRKASTETVWTKLDGNHEERLRRAVINQLGDLYGLAPARIPELPDHPPIFETSSLLRLEELGVKHHRGKGSYDHSQVQLSPYLAARHGWVARKNSGASAHTTLDHLGHSVIVGHTHRLGRVHQTKFSIDGKPKIITAVETGCMCRIEEGLGYAVNPDWQNGFAVATVWPNGFFSLDLATYVDGALIYRDQLYV